ncbi:hypothetical protein D9M73_235680 [compost metagenome]
MQKRLELGGRIEIPVLPIQDDVLDEANTARHMLAEHLQVGRHQAEPADGKANQQH